MSQPRDRKDELASMIAKAFGREDSLRQYQTACRQYDVASIEKAFEEANAVPLTKIKKSRSALFFYLLKKYGQDQD